MKYNKIEPYSWTDLLRAIAVCSEKFISKLESLNFVGTEKFSSAKVGRIKIIIHGIEDVNVGSKVNIVFQKRNDGIKQVKIFSQSDSENFIGIEMEEKIVAEQILNFLEACESGKREVLDGLYSN
jgi:esterase/lipase